MSDPSPLRSSTTWHIEGRGGAYATKTDAAQGQVHQWLQDDADLSDGVARKVVAALFAAPGKYLDMLGVPIAEGRHESGTEPGPHPGKVTVYENP